jgi:hypothetical protein
MTDVLQCPYCNLRFTTRSELDQHKAFDHPQADTPTPDAAPDRPKADPDRANTEQEQRGDEDRRPSEKRGFLDRLLGRR